MTVREQVRWWAIVLVVFVLLLWLLNDMLLPFVAGIAVAYFLDPVTDRLEAMKLSRTLATLVVLGVFVLAVVLLVLMVVPILHAQVVGFAERLPGYVETVRERIGPLLDMVIAADNGGLREKAETAVAGAAKDVLGFLARLLSQALKNGVALFNLVSLLFLTPIVAFYLLRDWDRIVDRVNGWLPRPHAEEIRGLARGIDDVLSGFVRGQGTICLILGVFYAASLSLIGLDFGLLIGLFAGLISFVPFLGAFAGMVLSSLAAFTQFWPDWPQILLVAGIFVVGQFLEGNFLTPRVLGERTGLHPVWVMFGLLAGGALFGFVGVLIAVPTTAAIGVVARYMLDSYLASRLYLGADGSEGPGGPEPPPAASA